jgi:HPt (histidine-containing phosphotransfer) domain-containing protein
MSMAKTIDRAVFAELEATAGAEFARELIDTFLEEAPPMLAELRNALAAGRVDAFRRAAHSLKSNASTFGALTLAAMARQLELDGIDAQAPAAVAALAQHYDEVAAALKALRHA